MIEWIPSFLHAGIMVSFLLLLMVMLGLAPACPLFRSVIMILYPLEGWLLAPGGGFECRD